MYGVGVVEKGRAPVSFVGSKRAGWRQAVDEAGCGSYGLFLNSFDNRPRSGSLNIYPVRMDPRCCPRGKIDERGGPLALENVPPSRREAV